MVPKEVIQFDEEGVNVFAPRRPIATILQGEDSMIFFEDLKHLGSEEVKKCVKEHRRISKELAAKK